MKYLTGTLLILLLTSCAVEKGQLDQAALACASHKGIHTIAPIPDAALVLCGDGASVTVTEFSFTIR